MHRRKRSRSQNYRAWLFDSQLAENVARVEANVTELLFSRLKRLTWLILSGNETNLFDIKTEILSLSLRNFTQMLNSLQASLDA